MKKITNKIIKVEKGILIDFRKPLMWNDGIEIVSVEEGTSLLLEDSFLWFTMQEWNIIKNYYIAKNMPFQRLVG